MTQATVKCPKCGEVIEISQAISHDIELGVKKKYEQEIGAIKKKAEGELRDKENENKAKLAKEKLLIEARAKEEAEEAQRVEVADLQNQLEEKKKRLEEAQKQELDLRGRQRELEDKEKAFELEMSRKLDSERRQIAEKVTSEIEQSHRLKDAEKDKQLTGMRNQIDDLKKKAEQASQKTQGEVLEIELEQLLKEEFQFDEILPVSSGARGADVVQIVKTQRGRVCGKILWETKRTKTWSDGWIQKLKEDQRKEKADLSVIVSEVLPRGFHHFRQVHDVWVTDIPSALSLAIALRMMTIQVARTREVQTGKEEKMEVVYNYLTGTEFRSRVQAIMEAFIGMKQGLDAEKRVTEKQWARREKQIDRVIVNIAGMHGDLEGIAGASLPAVKMLELPEDEPDQEEVSAKA